MSEREPSAERRSLLQWARRMCVVATQCPLCSNEDSGSCSYAEALAFKVQSYAAQKVRAAKFEAWADGYEMGHFDGISDFDPNERTNPYAD